MLYGTKMARIEKLNEGTAGFYSKGFNYKGRPLETNKQTNRNPNKHKYFGLFFLNILESISAERFPELCPDLLSVILAHTLKKNRRVLY